MFKRVMITSGPTIEPIDPVRFISNRSSGKTGYYLAKYAREMGAEEVLFITGKTGHIPSDTKVIEVETALEMRNEVLKYSGTCDVIIMAAAVCDFRSIKYYSDKIKKLEEETITLRFTRNPDILQQLGLNKPAGQVLVGFAAETENALENAERKRKNKNLDLLVLNEISEENPVFGSEFNQVFLVRKEGVRRVESMKKSQVARIVWQEISAISRER